MNILKNYTKVKDWIDGYNLYKPEDILYKMRYNKDNEIFYKLI